MRVLSSLLLPSSLRVGTPMHLSMHSTTAYVSVYATSPLIAHTSFPSPLPLAEVSPWSVVSESTDIAASLFAVSLIPYLALLWFLSRPNVRTPTLANFGFQFLLVFVFATIPAGIYAKVHYHDILANIDWLHGSAESMLTVTNLLIVFGLKNARSAFIKDSLPLLNVIENADMETDTSKGSKSITLNSFPPISLLLLSLPTLSSLSLAATHTEPWNALSIPTWMVHISSLLEWLVAMQLIWDHAVVSGNPRWKGLTLGMIPSHTSGLCACTYHFFYNGNLSFTLTRTNRSRLIAFNIIAPELNWIVALQAFLTLFGNSTMALAAFRVWSWERENGWYKSRGEYYDDILCIDMHVICQPGILYHAIAGTQDEERIDRERSLITRPAEELRLFVEDAAKEMVNDNGKNEFALKMLFSSLVLSLVVKYGELVLDVPFNVGELSGPAALCIVIPTSLNIAKWTIRSRYPASNFLKFF